MATLVRYPGGKKNRGNYNRKGKFYIRIWLPHLKKNKLLPCHTENRKEAEHKLKLVKEFEWITRSEESLLRECLKAYQGDQKLLDKVNDALGIDTTLKLSDAIDLYLKYCENQISENTVKSYRLALNNLTNSIRGNPLVTEIQKNHYQKILNHFKSKGYNPTTQNIRLRGIRAFLRWLVDNEYLEKMPFKVKMVKTKTELPKFMTPQEINKIYSKVNDPIMLSTFKVYEGTGMRLAELFNSKLNGTHLTVIGKGSKERIIPIPEVLISDYKIAVAEFVEEKRKAENEYTSKMNESKQNGMNDTESKRLDTVYRNQMKQRIQKYIKKRTDQISHAFTDAKRKAGIGGNKSLHALRHTFALRMLEELGDIYLVQQLLGHSSVKVTEIYTKFPMEYLKQVFKDKMKSLTENAIA